MVYFVLVLRGFLLSENFQYLYVRLIKIERLSKTAFHTGLNLVAKVRILL